MNGKPKTESFGKQFPWALHPPLSPPTTRSPSSSPPRIIIRVYYVCSIVVNMVHLITFPVFKHNVH